MFQTFALGTLDVWKSTHGRHISVNCATRSDLLQLQQQPLPDGPIGAGGGKGPARTETLQAAPTSPPGGVIEPHATMEHVRASQ